MRKLLFILPLFACLGAEAANIVTATVTVTNVANTTNGTITVNGNLRTWKATVVTPASEIATAASIGASATNLFNQISAFPYTSISLTRSGTDGVKLTTAPGIDITVTLSAGWGSVAYSTQALVSMYVFRVPYTGEAGPIQTNNVSGLVVALNANVTTNIFNENAVAFKDSIVGITNAQTITGVKLVHSVASRWAGIVSNSPSITGTVGILSNGLGWSNIFEGPISTNSVHYGISAPGSGTDSQAFGSGAIAGDDSALAVGFLAEAAGPSSTAVGRQAQAVGDSASAFGLQSSAQNDNSTAIGTTAAASADGATALGQATDAGHASATALGKGATTTAANQIMLGTATEYVHFPGNAHFDGNTDVTWLRYPITSLANGVNSAVPVGTNTFCEVSGPSSAFSIDGIANGRDGKYLIILNRTGQNMTINHESGSEGTAANRIQTMTAGARATTGNGAAIFIYDASAARWICLHVDP